MNHCGRIGDRQTTDTPTDVCHSCHVLMLEGSVFSSQLLISGSFVQFVCDRANEANVSPLNYCRINNRKIYLCRRTIDRTHLSFSCYCSDFINVDTLEISVPVYYRPSLISFYLYDLFLISTSCLVPTFLQNQ